MDKKIVVMGGGPAGYVAALRAAQLKTDVTLIESGELGGTCLNRGCIPTKALLKSAQVLRDFQNAKEYGIVAEDPYIDYGKILGRKDGVVGQLRTGVGGLLRASGVKVIEGRARFTSADTVRVVKRDSSEFSVSADSFIIATGSSPVWPPIPGLSRERAMTSDEIFAMAELPDQILIVGGGVIGVEFATVFASFGIEVAIVEMEDRLLPPFDREISREIHKILSKMGVDVYLRCKIDRFEWKDGKYHAAVTRADSLSMELPAERVLISVGRRANVGDLGLETAGVQYDRVICVDDRMRTNVSNIYAAGDVNGGMQLAHVASREGIIAAENAAGHESRVNYRCVPSCVFSFPEIAMVGMTEREAEERGLSVKVGRFPFSANGKALIENESEGFVKVIANACDDRILGVHIMGPEATVLICEAVLAIEKQATLSDIVSAVHAHPTIGEALPEAALGADHLAFHVL